MKKVTQKFVLGLFVLFALTSLATVFSEKNVLAATNSNKPAPVKTYSVADRVLKEFSTKCKNDEVVTKAIKDRCKAIEENLVNDSTDALTTNSKIAHCDGFFDFAVVKVGGKDRFKLDVNSGHLAECRDKVKTLEGGPTPSGGPGSTASRNSCGDSEIPTFFDFGSACKNASVDEGGKNNPIVALALTIVSWVTAFVSVAVVGGIVYGGFLYLAAQDNASQTQKGITIIVDSVIALILLSGMFVVINFIVPGGLFT